MVQIGILTNLLGLQKKYGMQNVQFSRVLRLVMFKVFLI